MVEKPPTRGTEVEGVVLDVQVMLTDIVAYILHESHQVYGLVLNCTITF